ncbi:LysR family transcriptional regulator [Neobacillus mesonae]|uniref:LysR family transcriptional regulator n=1 Tax=Neobacillus mesonae TaxID=1193713 RepID=UPI00203C036D|nr:LysR family transcriptional regulator [Neobacillus mesonae]MCM3569827.1 LysR family transcriptional regulator [Neobacillus mesonae]
MELKQLHYFSEVVKHGSFTKAAIALYTSQPSVSNAVKELEKELSVELLIRSMRKIELTDTGRLLFSYCQQMEHLLEAFQQDLDALKTNKTGVVRMGSTSTIGAQFFADVIAEFRKTYPDITIKFTEGGVIQLQKALLAGELDVMIVHTPVDEALFNYFIFLKGDLRLIVSKNHPLAGAEKVDWQTLKNENFILLPDGYKIRELILSECHKIGFSPKIICETSHWDFLIEMVNKEQGITILPQNEQKPLDIGSRNICIIPMEEPVFWELGIGWQKEGYRTYAAKTWIDFLQEKLL